MIKLAVTGACGRMGQRLVALSQESKQFQLVAALEYAGHPCLGQDIGPIAAAGTLQVPVTADLPVVPEVMIDFSIPAATAAWLQRCAAQPFPMVIGTTGLSGDHQQAIKALAAKVPMLLAPNMSLGVNLLFQIVAQVAKVLSDDYDIEIVEAHHRFKRDAPSGTALELARRIAQAKEWPFPGCLEEARHGQEALRQPHTIGMHAVRMGDVVGDHTVSFGTLGETIQLRHTAQTRDTFVRGALHAARWLVAQKPGLYSMADVLAL